MIRVRPTAALLSALLVMSAPLAATDYVVDGRLGSDRGDGSSAKPWKTIQHAIAMIPIPARTTSHRLKILGDHSYRLQSGLKMKFNVALVGCERNGKRPRLIASATVNRMIEYLPTTVVNRTECAIENLELEGGSVGIALGGAVGVRHQPAIEQCLFTKQRQVGILVDLRGGTTSEPHISRCRFENCSTGIEAAVGSFDSVFRPIIEECEFLDLSGDGYRLVDAAGGAKTDVGGTIRWCRFDACRSGVAIVSGTGAAKTRLDVIACAFSRCRVEGIGLRVALVSNTELRVSSCSFWDGAAGLRVAGLFAAGVHEIVVEDCVAARHRGPAFHYDFVQALSAVSIRVRSARNLAVTNVRGVHIETSTVGALGLDVGIEGDRLLACTQAGIEISGSASASSAWSIHSVIVARNGDGLRLNTSIAGTLAFATLVDHAAHGLVDLRKVPAVTYGIDHCIFANNKTASLVVPAGTRVEYSCIDDAQVVGRGNLRTDPKLVRPFYVLAPMSPCLDVGRPGRGTGLTDFEGDAREIGTAPDLGADEVSTSGEARVYGISGFGRRGLRPELTVPAPQQAFALGRQGVIALTGARDDQSTASAALFLLGSTEGPLKGPRELSILGSPTSFLQTALDATAWPVTVDAQGRGFLRLQVPNNSALVGQLFTGQFFVPLPTANAAGYVLTRAARVRIGR